MEQQGINNSLVLSWNFLSVSKILLHILIECLLDIYKIIFSSFENIVSA